MNKMLLTAAGLLIALISAAAPSKAETDMRQVAVADYTVFVDPPSGFVFVKLPSGWKFAGRVDASELTRLPATVVTALLKPDTELAGSPMDIPHQHPGGLRR
jgi:hypothetical protein